MTWRGWRSGEPDVTRGPFQKQDERKAMKTVLRAAAMIGAFLTTPAAAADLYGKAPAFAAAPFSGYNWNGAYVGVNLGYQWGKITNWPTSPNGVMGGAQVGYNWQIGQFVFGAEADLQGSGAEDTFAAWKFSNPWFGTLRGRAGYAFSNVLVYGTAGLAFGELRAQTFGWTESHTTAGWTIGAGAEVGFAPNWSAKLEYLYIDLSTSQFAITGVSNGYSASVVRAGVNYHF